MADRSQRSSVRLRRLSENSVSNSNEEVKDTPNQEYKISLNEDPIIEVYRREEKLLSNLSNVPKPIDKLRFAAKTKQHTYRFSSGMLKEAASSHKSLKGEDKLSASPFQNRRYSFMAPNYNIFNISPKFFKK